MSQFLIAIAVSVILLVFMIVKLKVHPVLSLFVAGILAGLLMGYAPLKIIGIFTSGFGGTLTGIGCTIIFGSIIAEGIRDTGSAKSMVNFFIGLFKGKNLELSTGMAAYIMSIPVFGDITQVLTAPIAAVIAKRDKKSMSTMGGFTMLAASLTHSMVPPTPGILAVAVLLGANLGLVILWGIIISIIGYLITWLLFRGWVAKEKIPPREDYIVGVEEVDNADYRNLLIKEEGLPSVLAAMSPILVPVVLITGASFADMYLDKEAALRVVFDTLGERNIALFIGVILTFLLGMSHKEKVIENFNSYSKDKESSIFTIMANKWIVEALQVALIPLLVTAMGGGFSQVIKSYSGVSELGNLITSMSVPAMLVPFLIGAFLMIAVGSRTTAGMTAAGICAGMVATLGLSPVQCAVLIGAGTMIGSHVSDSGFWVGTSLFNLNTTQGLKYITILGSITGIICLALTAAFMAGGLL
ncbi:MAG: GntP family permease [Synergistaceae bacterium]|nr:GntP family permease [Synergistaceae bacterium]